MKYVFIVHSHTLFLTSWGVINYLKLNPQDVILIHTRGFRTVLPLKAGKEVFADQEFDRVYDLKDSSKINIVRKEIRSMDFLIDQWIGEKFELFVPHLWSPFFKVLQTNKNCTKVSFVQEGAYTIEALFHNKVPIFERFKHRTAEFLKRGTTRLYGNGWIYDGALIHQKKVDAYALYPEYYQFLDCNLHIVEWPEVSIPVGNFSDGPVFIFDGHITHGCCTADYYMECCRRMIQFYAANKNYLRFHPAQKQKERDQICELIRSTGHSYEIMNDSVPFELIIKSCHNMTIVGMGSSLLFFAKAQGHTVHCCDTWLLDDPLYLDYHNQGVPLFNDFFNLKD